MLFSVCEGILVSLQSTKNRHMLKKVVKQKKYALKDAV